MCAGQLCCSLCPWRLLIESLHRCADSGWATVGALAWCMLPSQATFLGSWPNKEVFTVPVYMAA